ncbi:MAG TPA: hypothetical protein VGE01_14250 [Fimbriimonas sp.]
MRSLAIAICLLGIAHAQTTTRDVDAEITAAYGQLRANNNLFIELAGVRTLGTTTTELKTQAYWQTDTTVTPPVLRAEIWQYRNNELLSRTIGDGRTIWTYHNDSFTYSATPYGRWSQDPNPRYRADFIDLMTESAGEEASYIARLLREIFAGDNAAYRSWMPAVEPVNGTDDPFDVVYTLGDPKKREVVFDLDMEDTGLRLTGIDFYDQKKIGTRLRETTWRIDVLAESFVPPTMDFRPKSMADLAGWKQVTRPKPGIQ